ncbi:hypothetical protein LHJ74_13975 [Streptomyces sp. N2-109]|uniref:Uncharacterized protein n=1 Tax=Streptomyces gossypii TaxID=2883101 RepID=A0ABT2JU43_9ACTN|nr:hypothetical protein [Streptomyces gossypii]MCT2591004.1 hypothetical protein [Streptomyces gossypii]
MRHRKASGTLRRVVGVGVLVGIVGLLGAGTAHADEYHKNAHNGSRFTVVHVGQVDDPMEDVLEHTLVFGDGYTWD